ncbi:MAG: hypothetical protein HN855_08860 [Anaerolineae bacterium]|jgi:hypothetical protein|nr:hypothetical protein [Anaerolineae bacterium]MBT7071073.1 hypothetical protein [Anaerolineae bacterium]MBT7325255.1 hypothetical protein [Anaerolineae bacterium]
MDKKTTGLIATIAATLLCGLPGLCLCIFGAVAAAGVMPYTTEVNGISDSGVMPSASGFAMLCVALILILIPAAVAFFTLRKKPEDNIINAEPFDPPVDNDPLPPAS